LRCHRIRLQGPWQLEWIESGDRATRTVRLPALRDELFAGRSGRVRLTRRFHKPTNLEPRDVVSVALEDVRGCTSLRVNDSIVSAVSESSGAAQFAITELLQPVNTLAIEVDIEPLAAAVPTRERWGKVFLEIDSG